MCKGGASDSCAVFVVLCCAVVCCAVLCLLCCAVRMAREDGKRMPAPITPFTFWHPHPCGGEAAPADRSVWVMPAQGERAAGHLPRHEAHAGGWVQARGPDAARRAARGHAVPGAREEAVEGPCVLGRPAVNK